MRGEGHACQAFHLRQKIYVKKDVEKGKTNGKSRGCDFAHDHRGIAPGKQSRRVPVFGVSEILGAKEKR